MEKLEKLLRQQIIYKKGSDHLDFQGLNWKLVDFRYVSNYDYTLGQTEFKSRED